MKVKPENYYGFDHEAVNEKYKGELTFCNTFCIEGEYMPVAVYRASHPDRSKGHKRYLILNVDGGTVWARGRDAKDLENQRLQNAVHCFKCDWVVFSVNRHHMNYCKCQNAAIDGGKDYSVVTGRPSTLQLVQIDLITGKVL